MPSGHALLLRPNSLPIWARVSMMPNRNSTITAPMYTSTWETATNSAAARMYCAATPASTITSHSAACTTFFAALRVGSSKNVVHAALWLVIGLAGVAAQYILAAAEFVAVSQVLVYIGAVMVLFLFGIMLTRAQIGPEAGLNNRSWGVGIPVAVVLLALLSWVVVDAMFNNSERFANVNDDGVIVADTFIT